MKVDFSANQIRNIEARGAPAKAAKRAAQFTSAEDLASWMLSLVEEWSERDNKVYAIAEGGRCAAATAEHSIEASIFEGIEDQVEDSDFVTDLEAGIYRFKELLVHKQA